MGLQARHLQLHSQPQGMAHMQHFPPVGRKCSLHISFNETTDSNTPQYSGSCGSGQYCAYNAASKSPYCYPYGTHQ